MDPCHENILPKLFNKTLQASVLGFQGDTVVKNPPANAGDARDLGLIPGLGRSPGIGNSNWLQQLTWKIPWTEEPGGQESMGLQRVGYN